MLSVDDEPEIDTELCFMLCLELALNLLASGKLVSWTGTRDFRSTAGTGGRGASDLGLEFGAFVGSTIGVLANGIDTERPGVTASCAVLKEWASTSLTEGVFSTTASRQDLFEVASSTGSCSEGSDPRTSVADLKESGSEDLCAWLLLLSASRSSTESTTG